MPEDDVDSVETAMKAANRLLSVSDEELLSEFERRYPISVVIYIHRSDEECNSVMRHRYSGGFWTCLGMVQQQIHDMLHNRDFDL